MFPRHVKLGNATNRLKAQLNWYLFPPTEQALNAFWKAVQNSIRTTGQLYSRTIYEPAETAQSLPFKKELALGQMCGLTYARMKPDDISYVGSFVFDDPLVAQGWYRSVIITNNPVSVADIKSSPSDMTAAINEPDSYSGRHALYSFFNSDFEAPAFKAETYTGAHIKTLSAVAKGYADIGAIDLLSWKIIKDFRPDLTSSVFIAGYGKPMPAPPLVTNGPDNGVCGELWWNAVSEAFAIPKISRIMRNVGIGGVTRLEKAVFREFAQRHLRESSPPKDSHRLPSHTQVPVIH